LYENVILGTDKGVMSMASVPGQAAEVDDYRDSLSVVPEVGTLENGVAEIEFTPGGYRIDVTDFDNPLLEGEEPIMKILRMRSQTDPGLLRLPEAHLLSWIAGQLA
jgi:hypothetical protein